MNEDLKEFEVSCLRVSQPIGDFFIASLPAQRLVEITFFDVRRMLKERDLERYLGIQRPLNDKRVRTIRDYVQTSDACFPTGVIIAIEGRCARFDEDRSVLTISNFPSEDESELVLYRDIARVIDGQHRLAGLEDFEGTFEINVSIFVDADIADQANIFSTVNLAQTKVNRSLAYDLYELAKRRSPQKVAHQITVTLDRKDGSPFFKRIKRLGVATPGRTGETLTQATVVQPILGMMSQRPMLDRDLYMRGTKPDLIQKSELGRLPFRNLFIREQDYTIVDILWSYFTAVQRKWPEAWNSRETGAILNRTNGYRALMRLLGTLYRSDRLPFDTKIPIDEFFDILKPSKLEDSKFNTEYYKPGTAGESALFRDLLDSVG